MNYFWDVVDWLLPPVRIIDDLTDHNPSESSYRKTTHHHSSIHHHSSHPSRRLSGKEHDKDQDRDRDRERRREKERAGGHDRERTRERTRGGVRERSREKTRERTRDRERVREREGEREGRAAPGTDKEREQLRQRVQQLERENDSLLEQLRSTREELSKLSTAVFPTPNSRIQSLPASYPASPTDALGLVHPIPPAQSQTPTPTPHSPTSISPIALQSSYSAEAALTDPKRLRVLYSSLSATYTDARQTIRSQAEELASLKGFLSKTDDWSGAQLLQALADLNSEIIQLSASVAEEFAADFRTDVHAPAVAKERDRDVVRPALGREMVRLLEGREHAQDPTLVQFALQAWEVWCATRVMDAFCYGLPADVDESLRKIFDRMQREEPQPTTSRWRALTYRHARSLLRPRNPSSEASTPDSVAPSPFNSAPASIASSSALPTQLLSLTEANLRGVLAILALSGCTDARGLHRDPLRARYGSALARISARAERISSAAKEGVLSGLFEVIWCQPCRASPKAMPDGVAASVNGSEAPTMLAAGDRQPTEPTKVDIDINEIGANRGKGKEREWVEEVERARNGGDQEEKEQAQVDKEMFDWATMENVYAGHCNERCRVLCTVELGLAFTRRLPASEEREGSVDGDGMVVSNGNPSAGSRPPSSLSRPVSMGGVGLEGGAGANVSMSRSRSSANGTVTVVDGNRMVRNLLLKPKVLLESVVDIL